MKFPAALLRNTLMTSGASLRLIPRNFAAGEFHCFSSTFLYILILPHLLHINYFIQYSLLFSNN